MLSLSGLSMSGAVIGYFSYLCFFVFPTKSSIIFTIKTFFKEKYCLGNIWYVSIQSLSHDALVNLKTTGTSQNRKFQSICIFSLQIISIYRFHFLFWSF